MVSEKTEQSKLTTELVFCSELKKNGSMERNLCWVFFHVQNRNKVEKKNDKNSTCRGSEKIITLATGGSSDCEGNCKHT